jgi:two-component system, LytTR family, sensor histidine kinase AlgZ
VQSLQVTSLASWRQCSAGRCESKSEIDSIDATHAGTLFRHAMSHFQIIANHRHIIATARHMPSPEPQPRRDHDSPSAPEFAATRAVDTHGSVFGSTVLEGQAESRAPSTALFDVCHAGVVLRALLFVHALVAVGAMFVATTLTAWSSLFAVGSSMALPGVLMWLVVTCASKRALARLSPGLAGAAVIALGGASAVAGWSLPLLAGAYAVESVRWFAPAAAGAGMAAAVYHWLRLRALAQVPADTTAQLAELQSRIRPHFLFNTLNTALSLVRHDPVRAEGVLEDLAELFRVALTETGEAVTLDEEVELARRYLAIEQIRFGARLRIQWELDPAAGSARVPPLMLQPLVENAVRHGVEPAPDGGTVRIRTQVQRGRAVVSIANTVLDGSSNPGHGIALANVRERLRLMHDVAAQFDAALDGDVFRVKIVVPL